MMFSNHHKTDEGAPTMNNSWSTLSSASNPSTKINPTEVDTTTLEESHGDSVQGLAIAASSASPSRSNSVPNLHKTPYIPHLEHPQLSYLQQQQQSSSSSVCQHQTHLGTHDDHTEIDTDHQVAVKMPPNELLSSRNNESPSPSQSTCSSSGKMTKDEQWDYMYGLLLEFQNEHGHNLIPNRSGKLGMWVSMQRRDYKRGTMVLPRIQKLDKIDFCWETVDPPRRVPWSTRYCELVEYRALHGNCNVPTKCEGEYQQLGTWVSRQRNQRKRKIAQDSTKNISSNKGGSRCASITNEQIHLLTELGFQWEVARGGARYRRSSLSSSVASQSGSISSSSEP
eukprot:scaffold67638_cov64-Attheya_sp.AAC.1